MIILDKATWAVYDYIVEYKALNDGVSPTIRDITEGCCISSTSITHRHIKALCDHYKLLVPVVSGSGRVRGWRVMGGQWKPPFAKEANA